MTNAEVLDNMMKRMGSRTSPILRSSTLLEMNQLIKQLEQGPVLPWFLETRWEADTVADQDYIDLPSDFAREVEDGRFKIRNTNISPAKWTRLTKVTLEMIEDETDDEEAQLPAAYALFGDRVYFGPKPDKAYSFKLPYYKKTDAITDSTSALSNRFLLEFYNFVTLSTIDIVARTHTRDELVIKTVAEPLRGARDIYFRSIEARQHTNMQYLLNDSEN